MSSKDLSLIHTLFPMYSSTMTSRVPSSSYEGGESFAITMMHLLGAYYNLLSNLILRYPYESLGLTYSQALQLSFGNRILFGTMFKSEDNHSLAHQRI